MPSLLPMFHALVTLFFSVQLPDPSGTMHRPLDSHGQIATVFLFVAVDCPISNGYAPEIKRIIDKYKTQRVDFYLVYADTTVHADDVKKHLTDFGYTCPALLDTRRALTNLLRATATPEAAIVDPNGLLVYRGRIDNWYAAFGRHRPLATIHDLRNALDEIIADRQIASPVTKAIGCPI